MLGLSFTSCEDQTVPLPTNEISSSVVKFNAPLNLTATQGSYRSITLNWLGVEKAYQYYIYSSATPTADFELCGETKGSVCSYTVLEEPGTNRYYKVRAVKYDETLSPFSAVVMGSTLAVPSIVYIYNDSENAASTVSWWMKNCSDSTYKKNVKYEVRLFSSSKTEILDEKLVDGDTDTVTFENLSASTTYWYQVAAYVTTDQTKIEESAFYDSTTAHCLVPMAPLNLTAERGIKKDAVVLSWELPDFVEVLEDDGSYTYHPVYFTVSRKIKDSTEAWKVICDYAGIMKGDLPGIQVIPYGGDDKVTSSVPEYQNYIPKSTLTYSDTFEVVNGVQYEYKVQSYADDSADAVTSEKLSVSQTQGWLCPMPSISVSAEYVIAENKKYESISLSFNSSVKTFEDSAEYIYVLEEKKTDFLSGTTELIQIKKFDSTISLNNFSRTFDSDALQNNAGYYIYKVYVINSSDAESADDSNYETLSILSVSASAKITVTDDPELMPKIQNFTIKDGYSSKYLISWTYDETCVYSLSWNDYDVNENQIASDTYDLTEEDVSSASDGTAFTYEHAAPSGTRRLYTLTANKGLEVSKTYEEKVYTLGTPKIVQRGISYDSICIEFDEVLKADSYEVEAEYSDSAEKINYTDEQLSVDETDNAGTKVFKYTLSEPEGFDDALKSGKEITLKVKAINSSTGDSTTGSVCTCTMGPALVKANIENFKEKEIDVTWNEIPQAGGYLVFRTKYIYNSDSTKWISRKSFCDAYYIEGTQISVAGGDDICKEVSLSLKDGVYTLNDVYELLKNETSSYEVNQANIIAGLPYGYTVIPVLSQSDVERDYGEDEFDFGSVPNLTCRKKFAYKNISETVGSTYGYGLNVRAAKCEDRDAVKVEWNVPYKHDDAATLYKRPAGSSENSWTKVNANVFAGDVQAEDKLSAQDKYNAFEYAVVYKKTTASISLDDSFVKDAAFVGLSKPESRDKYEYSGTSRENQNKGYLMVLPFSAQYGGDTRKYSETVIWDEWNFEEKSIAPESYELYIRNYNLGSGWVKAASINREGEATPVPLFDITSTSPNKTSLNLEVTSLAAGTSGTTNGMLKVLRDAKHYYKLCATRGELSVDIGDEGDIFAYRQITDEELVKGALLVMAYGFYLDAGGGADLGNVNSKMKYQDGKNFSTSNGGTASFGKGSYTPSISEIGKYAADVNFTNYAPSMKTPSGEYTEFLKITAGISVQIKGTADYYLNRFRNDGCTVTVSALDADVPGNRTLSFTMETTESKKLTVKVDGKTLADTSSEDVRRQWFPVQYSDDHSWIADTSYGWWVE